MELPAAVLIHNELIGVKGGRAVLLNISEHGYYEVNLKFGENVHRVLLPVATSVVISREPEEAESEALQVER